MALDLFSPLKVVSWASAHADCPMRYKITSPRELVITFGSGTNEFELSLDHGALRSLVELSTEALTKLDTDAEERLAERADRRADADTPPALEGDATLRRLTDGRPSERC